MLGILSLPAVALSAHLYVGIRAATLGGLGAIEKFKLSARGNASPETVLAGDKTTIGNPQDMAWDKQGYLYVLDDGNYSPFIAPRISVFAPGARGNVAPVRVIMGPSTGFSGLGMGVAVDNVGDLYVTDPLHCYAMVFAPGANGNVAPSAFLQTGCGGSGGTIALDPLEHPWICAAFSGQVQEYDSILEGGRFLRSTQFPYPSNAQMSTIHGRFLYVVFGDPTQPYIGVYTLHDFKEIAVLTVPTRFRSNGLNKIAVADTGTVFFEVVQRHRKHLPSEIAVFPSGASRPIGYISGPRTGLGDALGLEVGP